jgi:biopolymer transport protein ExbD
MDLSYSVAAGLVLLLVLVPGGCGRTETANSQAGGTTVVNDNRRSGEVKQNAQEADKSRLPTPDSPYVKVYVSKSGVITLDGKTVALDELGSAFAALAGKHGIVLYSRESPEEAEPHSNALKVVDLVIQNNLPVRLCVNKDCSDALDPQGKLLIKK